MNSLTFRTCHVNVIPPRSWDAPNQIPGYATVCEVAGSLPHSSQFQIELSSPIFFKVYLNYYHWEPRQDTLSDSVEWNMYVHNCDCRSRIEKWASLHFEQKANCTAKRIFVCSTIKFCKHVFGIDQSKIFYKATKNLNRKSYCVLWDAFE